MIGVTSITRYRSRYSAWLDSSKPGATRRTVAGARISSSRLDADITMTASVRTVWANRGAASAAERASEVNTGTNGAVSPDATRTSRASSGSTKAAL